MINLDIIRATQLAQTFGTRMEHDAAYFSLYMGTPLSIDDQWIGYLNDQYLNVFSWSLRDGSGLNDSAVRDVIDLARGKNLDWIEFWGSPVQLPTNLEGVTVSHWQDPSENMEVQLDLRTLDWQRSRRQKELRKGARDRLQVRAYRGSSLRPEHQKLLDDFIAITVIDDLAFVTCAEQYLQNPHAVACEIIDDVGKITGIGIASTFLNQVMTFHHLFHDGTSCASTMMYDYMIQFCAAHGIGKLGLGYSLNAGLLAYKKNLGAGIFFPPNVGTKLTLA